MVHTLPHEKKIIETEQKIAHLKKKSKGRKRHLDTIFELENALQALKQETYANLSSWDRVAISRHPDRPKASDYIHYLAKDFKELHGDRQFGDDPALIGGLGCIEEVPFMIIGQEKGRNTEERLQRNFGMLHPEGYRKALRLMRLAEKFHIPILSFVDTPGAYPGLEAEERGQGLAIANNLAAMAEITVPIIVVLIGEGCSGGALGMALGDEIIMLEHAYYSVISPEGCAAILWKDSKKKEEAAERLCLNAESVSKFGVVDTILKEPPGGAHTHPETMLESVKTCIMEKWRLLNRIPVPILLEQRYLKFRKIGKCEVRHDAPSV